MRCGQLPLTLRSLSRSATSVLAPTQAASRMPSALIIEPPAANDTPAASTLASNAHFSRRARSGTLASRQRANGPTPIRNTAGAISGTNTASKYGGPTEILPSDSASSSSGYSVPSITEAAATASSTLLASSIDSRETAEKPPPRPTLGARQAKSSNELPTTATRKPSMKMPRFGSVAKACTEVSRPERTMKVPSRLSENARIASSTVQLRNTPRFSVTASEWINAVPTSHGRKEAFSTGSQNHQPPQPSS